MAPGLSSASNGVSGSPTRRWLSVCTQIVPSWAVKFASRPGNARQSMMTSGTICGSALRSARDRRGRCGGSGRLAHGTFGLRGDRGGRGRCAAGAAAAAAGAALRRRVGRGGRCGGRRRGRRRRGAAQGAVITCQPLGVVGDRRARPLRRRGLPRQCRQRCEQQRAAGCCRAVKVMCHDPAAFSAPRYAWFSPPFSAGCHRCCPQ